jgi:hypothetical protein
VVPIVVFIVRGVDRITNGVVVIVIINPRGLGRTFAAHGVVVVATTVRTVTLGIDTEIVWSWAEGVVVVVPILTSTIRTILPRSWFGLVTVVHRGWIRFLERLRYILGKAGVLRRAGGGGVVIALGGRDCLVNREFGRNVRCIPMLLLGVPIPLLVGTLCLRVTPSLESELAGDSSVLGANCLPNVVFRGPECV